MDFTFYCTILIYVELRDSPVVVFCPIISLIKFQLLLIHECEKILDYDIITYNFEGL
jgi:hypothetical protein